MTDASDRFTDEILVSWDNADCYESTAELGLSEIDEETLRAYCDETDEDYDIAEAEVMAFVRGKASKLPPAEVS